MCSGCMTWGNSTRFGSGNSRAVPLKELRTGSSSLMKTPSTSGSGPVGLARLRLRPVLGGRVEADDRDQGLVGAEAAVRAVGGQDLGEAALHLLPEPGHVEPQ